MSEQEPTPHDWMYILMLMIMFGMFFIALSLPARYEARTPLLIISAVGGAVVVGSIRLHRVAMSMREEEEDDQETECGPPT